MIYNNKLDIFIHVLMELQLIVYLWQRGDHHNVQPFILCTYLFFLEVECLSIYTKHQKFSFIMTLVFGVTTSIFLPQKCKLHNKFNAFHLSHPWLIMPLTIWFSKYLGICEILHIILLIFRALVQQFLKCWIIKQNMHRWKYLLRAFGIKRWRIL